MENTSAMVNLPGGLSGVCNDQGNNRKLLCVSIFGPECIEYQPGNF